MLARKTQCWAYIILSILLISQTYATLQEDERFKTVSGGKKNVVLIIIDDLGQQDLGIYHQSNSTIVYHTPNIDRLASKSVKFNHAYATHPRCIPARVSLLTGKYPARFDIPNDPKFHYRNPQCFTFGKHDVTFAEKFKAEGYKTAYIGKWHLSNPKRIDDESWPWHQGFDISIGIGLNGNTNSYFWPYYKKKMNHEPLKNVYGAKGLNLTDYNWGKNRERAYLTDSLTESSVAFIKRNKNVPFLLVLSHYAVHSKIEAPEKEIKPYEATQQIFDSEYIMDYENDAMSKTNQNNPTYAAMVTAVDRSVGKIMRVLDKKGLSNNTVIILTSDNGGLSTSKAKQGMSEEILTQIYRNDVSTSNLPFRHGKGWLYEGGIRVPLLISSPGEKPRESECPVTGADLFPTMLDLAGSFPSSSSTDGKSLKCIVENKKCTEQICSRPLFWHNADTWGIKTTGNPRSSAIRKDKWKLIENLDKGSVELFDLETDKGETNNLATILEGKTEEMLNMLHKLSETIHGSEPTPVC